MRRFLLVLILAPLGCSSGATPMPEAAPNLPAPKFEHEFSEFDAGDPDADPPRPASVLIKIIKDDPECGVVSWSGSHQEGGILGWSVESGSATSRHLVFSPRKKETVLVDFDTDITIERLVVNKVEETKTRQCPIIRKPLLECPGPEPTLNAWRRDEVHCKARTSGDFIHQRDTLISSKDNEICLAHGGKDEPRWTRKDLIATLEPEAAQRMREADYDWQSRNPKMRSRARDAYLQLLLKYGETELVRRNLEQIKSRSEAEIED